MRAERVWMRVNGTRQAMFLVVDDPGRPILLFVHGGPGMPEYWLTRRYPIALEQLFTVAWWEQRGAGLSYRPRIPAEEMTVERFVSDTIAVTDHLRERFRTDKVYLLAHSWGSCIGLQAASRAPERYHAYIGVAQMTHQIRSEALAYRYMLDRCRELGETRMARRLEESPVTDSTIPLPRSYLSVRDRAMHRLGVGTTREMRSVVTGLFLPSLRFPGYSVREKVDLWRGKVSSRRSPLWNELLATDLTERITELAVPAYFLHGRHDYTASYELARAYARQIHAPVKGFYTFDRSAHSPIFEEPQRTLTILREDVLTGQARQAEAG